MLSHDLARKLLSLPNLPVVTDDLVPDFEPVVSEVVDHEHPSYKPLSPDVAFTEHREAWYENMPKRQVILI